MTMTISRFAVSGALILSIPAVVAVTVLPGGAVAIAALVLAALGGALGAMTGWAIDGRVQSEPRRAEAEVPGGERMAA